MEDAGDCGSSSEAVVELLRRGLDASFSPERAAERAEWASLIRLNPNASLKAASLRSAFVIVC